MIAEHEPELDRTKLLQLVALIRTRGYASTASREVDGITDLSAPILEHDHAVCALTVPFMERRLSSTDLDTRRDHLRRAAADISEALQYGTPSRSPSA